MKKFPRRFGFNVHLRDTRLLTVWEEIGAGFSFISLKHEGYYYCVPANVERAPSRLSISYAMLALKIQTAT
jgi:hypothetical protein